MIYRLLLFFCSTVMFAQLSGVVRGRVVDAQGAAVPEAKVRLLRESTTLSQQTQTGANGEYRFANFAPGEFILEVEKEPFRRETRTVRIEADVPLTIDVSLSVAGVNQTVVVTASGAAQVEQETSKAISVIGQQEILDRNAVSLVDVIRYTPGVQIRNGGGPGHNTSLRIRGLRPDAAAVLVDGLRFRDASTIQADASSFLSTLNFIDAGRVEVLRGSGSSLYGTHAVGGVVNVVTDEGSGPLHGQVQAEGGNLGLFRGRAAIGGGALQDRLKFSAGLLHLNIADGVDGNDATRSTGGQGMLRFDLTPNMSLNGRFWGSDDFVQLNISPTTAGIPAANFPATGFIPAQPLSQEGVQVLNARGTPSYGGVTFIPGRNDPDSRRSSRLATSAVVFRHTATPLLQWQASYQRVHTSRVFQDGPVGNGGFQPVAPNYSNQVGDIDTATVHGTAQVSRWLSVTGGYEFERENYFTRQDNNLPAPQQLQAQTRAKQDSHAGFFATQLALVDRRLQISLSGRTQGFQLSHPQFQLSGTANNYDRVALASPPQAWTGDASIAYLLAPSGTKLRAHFGNAYRAPALFERFGGGFSASPATGLVGFTPYGDPRLASDRYNLLDAGIDQYLFSDRVRIAATMFYSRVIQITGFDSSGAIVNPATDPFGRTSGYINGSGGISRGVELGVEARPARSLTLRGSYTYTNADTDQDLSVRGVYSLPNVQPHTATLVATQRWGRRLDTTLDLFYGSSYFTPFFAAGRSRAFQFPGYTRTGLTVNYRLWEGEKRAVRAYTKVDNLFNQTYYEAGWLATRATFVVGLGYGF